VPRLGYALSVARGLEERLLRLDQMVRRQHQHDRSGAKRRSRPVRGKRDRRCGIAPLGFEQETGCDAAAIAFDFVARLEVILAVGDQENIAAAERRGARVSVLQQALAVGQADEWLGIGGARNRPEPRPGTAAEDHRQDLGHAGHST
jgi:hypothetical protein